jgi:hypothetical protein
MLVVNVRVETLWLAGYHGTVSDIIQYGRNRYRKVVDNVLKGLRDSKEGECLNEEDPINSGDPFLQIGVNLCIMQILEEVPDLWLLGDLLL